MNSARPSACIVCGGPLPTAFARAAVDERFCDAPRCRQALSRRETMRPVDFEFWVGLQARHVRAQAELKRADALLLTEKQNAEAAENLRCWDALDEACDGGRGPAARIALPSGPRRLVNLPQSARSIYRDQLTRIITQAVCGSEPLEERLQAGMPQTPAEDDALGGQLCATCSGGCCTLGGTTAYLSASTIRRYMALHPQLRPRDVLNSYLERLQTKTERGSCVNHTSTGCGLSREMRADICNQYLCQPRKDLRARIALGEPPPAAVVIIRRQDQWHRDETSLPNDIVGTARVTATGVTWLTQDAGVFVRSGAETAATEARGLRLRADVDGV